MGKGQPSPLLQWPVYISGSYAGWCPNKWTVSMQRLYHKLFNMSVNTTGYRLMALFLLFYVATLQRRAVKGFRHKVSKEMDSVQDWSMCKSRRIITLDSYCNNKWLKNLIDHGFYGFLVFRRLQ
jgi:hypothetical protein